MQYISVILRSILIISLLPVIVTEAIGSEKPDLVEQTIKALRDCVNGSPASWPDEWEKEYIETIRKAVELHRDASNLAERLEILRNGFGPYWESFNKISERI